MSNQIIGNTEYNSIKEKAYINGTQENIMQLAAELDKAGINYSGRVSDYRSAITVEAADRAKTLEIMKGVLNAAKEKTPAENAEKNIIGNAEYRYISNKRYIRGETEAMLRTADRLTAENISFSGRINGDTVTITVSGDETQELVKRYFAEEKNRIENVQSAYFLALSSDTFEDGYYFSEVNTATGEEIAPYRSSFGDISMFVSVDSAVRYAEGAGVTLSNTDEQLNEWRRTEAEAEAEKERQLNLSRSREIIKLLPMTEKDEYEEHFVFRDNAIDWIYFNPDGANGEGQFVQTSLYADDLIAAYNARSDTENYNRLGQSAFIETIQNGRQTVVNADTEEFERLADIFIKSRGNENVIVSAPLVSGNKYDSNFERIINLLENHFDDVRKYKGNHITEASENISVEGHIGTWYVIAAEEIEGRKLFLLEHEKYGDETANIIIDENKNLVMEDVWNGFDDYRESLEYDDDKQFVSRDFAVELWQNGFTVFMNDRSNELTSRKSDPKGFDLFLDENNNAFYAFNKDIVQQRLLDDTVTLLDGLNDAAIIEAGEHNKSIDTAENYAKDMFDDGDCAYRWNEGITEWQNISASILSGNTEYIYAWLNDLPLELPHLEENRDVSITEALNYLDNYEKQYMNKLLSADELKKGTRIVYNDINWEVTHINNYVLALKNLDSDKQMSSIIIEDWQNTVTRNKVKFIEENSPVGINSQEAAENNSKKTLIINAFGGPGAGKSTACLHIASELKKRGFVAEYVSEYAKDLVWDKNFEMLDGSERHQKLILEEQKKRMDRLIGQVDFVVTDAPVLLNSVYLNSDDKSSYDEALVNLFNQYDNFNLEVIRDVNNFEEEVRIHNLEQSQQADNDIRTLLNRNNIYFGTYSHNNLDKIVDNAVVTYGKLSSKPTVIPEIPSRLSVNSPVGKYVPDENLSLSEQLYELAKRELADYENSLDTAEKAKAAAYELSVKRDILSYIEYDLAEDITDPDVDTACRRLISTGYPLDSFYQDWLKNEYDNRMEAIRMTAADTFRKEIPQDYKLEAYTKDYVIDGQEGTWSVVNHTEINGRQLFELESDNYGYTPEVGHIIADVDGSVLAENVHNGFENFYLEKQRIEEAREIAHNAGLPFREAVADPEEEFNPYAFDGTMSPEDYELMHKHIREDSFEIYQVKSGEEYHGKRFVGLSELGSAPNVADYDLVFSGKLSEIDITAENKNEILESIFTKFNTDRPEDFKGHSLSVSDIVVLHKDDTATAHYVDTVGFNAVPEFLKEKTATPKKSAFDTAVELINEYAEREFGETANFSNTDHVDLAYTTHEITELPIEVYADLDTFRIVTEYDGKLAEEKLFNSLDDMNRALGNLDFNELVYVSDDVIDRLTSKDKSDSPVGKPMLQEGDLITLADRQGVWKVSAVTDMQIEFENTDPNSPEKSFSRIDFGQHREHLQEILQYTLVSEREGNIADKEENSPMGTKETAIHNAFRKLKDNHDFSPEVVKLLERVEKLIIGNDWENFNSKIFEVPLFQQTYGSVSRVNEKLFGGELRSVMDEVNGYIFEEQIPNKELFSESDLSTLREIKAEHDRTNSDEADNLQQSESEELIAKFVTSLRDKYDPYHTTLFYEYRGYEYQVENFGGKQPLGESLKEQHQREQHRIDDMIDNPTPILPPSNNVENAIKEFLSYADDLKTVTNQYNSYLIVQDVHYALEDLLNGTAENYDWKNYAEAFKKVLDSNVNTDVALPLYKSGTDEILSAAAEKKEISADGIARTLSNLELVLQNSHLLKNPEEKVEQISFFDSTPSRKSSDGIGFYSSAAEIPQNKKENSPLGNGETQKKEKSFAEQVDESLNGTLSPFTTIKICDTPQILLDIGCEQLPMLYTQKHLKNAVKPLDEKEHQHGLTVEQIKKLPELLEAPVMVFDSISKKDSLVVVTSEFDTNDNPVVVSVKPNGKGRYEVEEINSNFVTSVYGRNNFIDFFQRTLAQDNVLYLNKNKSQEMFERWGEQYSELTNNLSSDIIIHQSKNIVNTPKPKNNDYTITDKNYGADGGAKTRFANNVAAIKLLKTIEKENRTATPEEQEVLAKYVGWGGIANAFDSRKPDWSKEYTELKDLLTDQEYRAARASTMNAHYTSPTVINAIYSALDNMGFDGGKIIEPAMGIGNFFGTMPENIRSNSDLYGVELDSITGRIAKQLYPSANIQIKGYEDTNFENGSFDAAVGNVPFGDYKLNDKDYNKQNLFIHDYFFAKTLDKVRAGGVVAFVTSKGTLDKENPEVRKYLAERAELLGAIRLPNNAFKANAGTEVTSDIIFLQKRERPISIENDTPEWVYKDMLPNGIAVNKYFADHPEMILGEMVEGNKLYGNQTNASMCVPVEGADLEEQLAEAVKNITGEYKAAEKEIAEKSPVGNTDEISCPPNAPKYSFIVQDDILYYHKSSDTMEKYNAPEKSIEKIKAMAQLRDNVHKLLDLQLDNTDGRFDNAISETQTALNRQYDDFSEKYGLISNAENKMLFRSDNSYHLIKSLERLDKDGSFIGKADIFSKITVNPKTVVDRCDNAQDALILSLSEKMCVNLEYMSILTGKSEEELISELGDKIFQNPQKYMRWESADEYLTGNIRSKLAAAEAAGLTRNAEALRAVMPERIEASDIAVKLGSAWIDPDYIRQFIVETLKPDFVTSKNIEVTYMPATDKWKVEGWRSAYENTLANETYGTLDMNAYEIIENTLNMQKAEVRQRVKDERGNDLRDSKGRYVYEVNQQKTMIVQAKQDELKRKFADWIFSDPDRREKLVDVYNEKFNSVRLREYDGSHLNFVGMSSAITLKEHQKNAVARGLYSNGNTLLAHEVGAGKTFEMIAIAMEGKRLGLHNKSLITAPNGLTEQWGNAFRTLYPNANVLVATEKDFKKENRRDLFAKIATGDWDAVVIGHSQFDMIHLSRERELEVLHTELDRLEEALREMDDGVGRKSFSVKQIEKSIKAYEDKIEKLLAKAPEDDMLCFEKLGIDKIFVDESQAYKNLDIPTKMRNVSGIGSGGSGRSMQLLMKCKYLDELTGGKGCVFASGTPISNSMSEMYTLMRYLQADKLAELGINSFDRWASVFGETVSSMELSPEGNGKYQMKTRFARFQNLPELMNIFKECADIKTAETLDLDRPDFEMHNINVPSTAIQATMIKELGERAKEIRAGDVDPTEDNMCKLTVDGRKIGLDQRCMNPNLPDDPKSKVNVCINNVFDIWQRTAEEKSTQLIFCDLATPQPTLNENTYTVYRPNTKGGYSDVYSAKLGEKDTAEKIMNKLNGKKPPKNYEAGDVADGDIIMLKRVNYEEETAYNTAFEIVDGKLTEASPETWAKLHHNPVEHFESERRFCVYDDIKQKLVEKGVPEKEIAFIHDVDKAEDKQKLYDKMNKGEIRVLIGSTFKCGAGMNAQERMIALHDLDAPMRPSDMEQRHGRIIRQGNTNSKVDIYRYTTDKTFDAYLYQMLENKQRFISQIMTDKSPVRSCEDVDEVALDYAEVKALCAGNPLIREKIDLETEITKLNVLKSAFLSQKYSLQDKAYKSLPEHRKITEHYIENLRTDIETVQSIKPLVNEDGKNYYPVTVGGREYHDKEKAGQAIRNAIICSSELTEKKQCPIGTYRGFEMTAFLDTKWEENTVIKINLKGACDHSCEINMNSDVKASGNIIRLDNVINGIELELQKQEDRLQSLNADIKEAEIAAEAVFPQEQELTQKEKRLAEVNNLLTDSEIRTDNSMGLYAALVEICPELESYKNLSCKYEKGEDSGIEPLIVEKCGDTVFIAHTYVQNGDLMYDPVIEFSFDTQNHRAEALSYELSGMGIYQDFYDGNLPDQKADVEEMALDVMFENIKAYGYERTSFNADDDRVAEKEIKDVFNR